MHNRKKTQGPPDPEKEKRREKRKQKLAAAHAHILTLRQAKIVDETALEATGSLLSVNAEFYTAWNYRREILTALLEKAEEEKKQKLIENELQLTQQLLPENPKSYWLWEYRRWVLIKHHEFDKAIAMEITLCAKMLNIDTRNFHCWRHRLWATQQRNNNNNNNNNNENIKFVTQKINSNFSNYSAWHYRSVLLAELETGNHPEPTKILEQEFEFTQQGCFTDPEDQSGWLYHHWLVHCCQVNHSVNDGRDMVPLLEQQVEMCEQLIELEDSPLKWATLTQLKVLGVLTTLQESTMPSEEKEKLKQKRSSLREILCQIDPMRERYYLTLAV